MDVSWTNTTAALQDFVSIMICGKCKSKPVSPVRLTNCGHFFCHECIKSATKCDTCDVPVRLEEICHDHVVSNLIQNCDKIAEIINKRDIWNNIMDTSVNTVSKVVHTPKKQIYIPKRNINKKAPNGETLLHKMCVKRKAEEVKLLLLSGADPNTKDNVGWTPLQEAISFGYNEICELLLKGGALPDIPGYKSKRPLHEAVVCNNIEAAKLLLQYHADTEVYDSYGKRPIDYCESKEKEKMREILTAGLELQSSSDKLSDVSQSLDRSFVAGCDKFVIFASKLKPENKKLLGLVAAKHKLKISTTMYRSSVTHVIVEANEQDIIKLTLDILYAIVRGCWILNSEWIALALDMENILQMDLELFELTGAPRKARQNMQLQNPRLFDNCFFYFSLQTKSAFPIGDMRLTKNDLINLVTEGGGTVLTRKPDPEDLKDMSQVIPFHVANNSSHPLHRCTHYEIYLPGKGEPLIKYKMPHIKSLPLMWLIECIEKFTLIDPAYIGLF